MITTRSHSYNIVHTVKGGSETTSNDDRFVVRCSVGKMWRKNERERRENDKEVGYVLWEYL